MENDRKFFVDTPMGRLVVYAKHETDSHEDYPGIYIDLENPNGIGQYGDPVCTVEYDSGENRLQTVAYGAEMDAPMEVTVYETIVSRQWKAYCQYLTLWASTHKDPGFAGCCPACFDEFIEHEWENGYKECPA